MLPETVIDKWREWSGDLHNRPVILGPLSGGRSNRSFLLESDQGKLVLRINGSDSLLPDANRQQETVIWQAASQQGIAPPLLYVDENNRFLLSHYIENDLPTQPPFNTTYINQAFGLLKRCHQLKVKAPVINYVRHNEQYWQKIEFKNQLSNPALLDQRAPMQTLLKQLITSNTPTGLCHHDPVIANFVGDTKRLYLIDWEYAAHGMLIMDFAALAVEWHIDDTAVMQHSGIEAEALTRAKVLYKYLCDLWAELRA